MGSEKTQEVNYNGRENTRVTARIRYLIKLYYLLHNKPENKKEWIGSFVVLRITDLNFKISAAILPHLLSSRSEPRLIVKRHRKANTSSPCLKTA